MKNSRRLMSITATAILASASLTAEAGFKVIREETAPVAPALPANSAASQTAAPVGVPASAPQPTRVRPFYISLPPADEARVTGLGKDVRLVDAVKQIAPEGWKGFVEGGVDTEQKVNWSAENKRWSLVLMELLGMRGLWAEVNWGTKEIKLLPNQTYGMAPSHAAAAVQPQPAGQESRGRFSLPPFERGARPPIQQIPTIAADAATKTLADVIATVRPAGWEITYREGVDKSAKVSIPKSEMPWPNYLQFALVTTQHYGQLDWDRKTITIERVQDAVKRSNANGTSAPTALVAPLPQEQRWHLQKGRTLQQTLEAWGKDAGWAIVWKPDFKYIIAADAILSGPFSGTDGVVGKLLVNYQSADRPLIAEFFNGNKVLEIREAPTTYASK